ncbi:MAG: hypothetical protein ACOH2A_13605 [Sphingobacteriaceae bacterium]
MFTEKPGLFLLCITVGLIFCVAIVFTTPASYRVRIALPHQNEGSVPSLKSATNNAFFEKREGNYTDDVVGLVISTDLANQLVTKLDLQNEYFQIELFKKRALYSGNQPVKVKTIENKLRSKQRFDIDVISENSFILADHDGKTTYQFKELINKDDLKFTISKDSSFFKFPYKVALEISSHQEAAQHLIQKIAIETANPSTGEIQVSVEDKVLRKAFDIADTLYNNYLLNKNSFATNETARSIQKQISSLDKYFAVYEKTSQIIQRPSKSVAKVDRNVIQQAEMQLDILETLDRYTKISVKQFSLIPDNYGLLNNSLNSLIQKINSIQLKKQKVLSLNDQENAAAGRFDDALLLLRKQLILSIKKDRKYFKDLKKTIGIPESTSIIQNNPDLPQKQSQNTVEYKENLRQYAILKKQYQKIKATEIIVSGPKKQLSVAIKTYYGSKKYNVLLILLGLTFSFVFPLVFTLKKGKRNSLYNKERVSSKKLSMGY